MNTKVNHYNASVLLGQHITQTHQVLRKVIPDRIKDGKRVPGRFVCTPFDDARGQGNTFLARESYSRLLGTGLAIDNGGGGQGRQLALNEALRFDINTLARVA